MQARLDENLKMAILVSDYEIAKELIIKGASLSTEIKNETIIQKMANEKQWDMVDFIATTARGKKRARFDIERFGSALLAAVMAKRYSTVEKLLKAGAKSYYPDLEEGNYPLHHAVKNQQPGMIALLLKYGADQTCRNNKQQTPYELAVDLKKLTCWEEGWKMYYKKTIPTDVLPALIQGQRQADLPDDIIEKVCQFLWQDITYRDLSSAKEDLYKVSLNCFVTQYSSGLFHYRSQESIQLVNKIKDFLIAGNTHLAEQEISDYLSKSLNGLPKDGYKESRAISLLQKYRLVTSEDVVEKSEEPGQFRLAK